MKKDNSLIELFAMLIIAAAAFVIFLERNPELWDAILGLFGGKP